MLALFAVTNDLYHDEYTSLGDIDIELTKEGKSSSVCTVITHCPHKHDPLIVELGS